MMNNAIYKKEILERGYYGLSLWFCEEEFNNVFRADVEVLKESEAFVSQSLKTVKEVLFGGKEVDLPFPNMPILEKWILENYSQNKSIRKWLDLTIHRFYYKCGLTKEQIYEDGEPSWCDYVSSIWTTMLGELCSNEKEFQDWERLEGFLEGEVFHWDFYNGFHISNDIINDYISNCSFNLEEIIKRSHILEGALEEYDTKGKEESEIISTLNVYEECAEYVVMPRLAVFVADKLYEQERYNDLNILWRKLQNPILQYNLLMSMHLSPEGSLNLLDKFNNLGADQVSLSLIRDYWFMKIVKDYETLLQYENPRGLVDDVQKAAQLVAADMLTDLKNGLDGCAKNLLNYFTAETLAKWIYGKSTLADKPESLYKQAYTSVMNAVKEALPNEEKAVYTTQSKDINYLLFLASQALNCEEEKRKDVEKSIMELIDNGKFGWHGDLNVEVIQQMTDFGKLLKTNHTIEELNNIYYSRRIVYEGWKVTPYDERANRGYMSAYIAGALLLTTSSLETFRSIVVAALDQLNRNKYPDNAVKAPLIIAELIVLSEKVEWKDWYEQYIIDNIEGVEILLQILNYSKSDISDVNKKNLKLRINEEWPVSKRRFIDTNRSREVKAFEQLIQRFV